MFLVWTLVLPMLPGAQVLIYNRADGVAADGSVEYRIGEVRASSFDEQGVVEVFVGGGAGATYVAEDGSEQRQVHFTPAGVYYRFGLLGLTGFVVVAALSLRTAWRSRSSNTPAVQFAAAMVIGSLAVSLSVYVFVGSPLVFLSIGVLCRPELSSE